MPKDTELKNLIRDTVEETVKSTLLQLGIDVADPIAAQEEMAAIREIAKHVGDPEYQADQLHLRKWRKSMESASNMTLKTALGVLVTSILGALWLGLQQLFKH